MGIRPNNLQSNAHKNAALTGMATALFGLVLLASGFFVNASYDLPWRFASRGVTNRVVLIEMDAAACGELHQTRKQWDRMLHARLLDYLRQDGCPLVVFDIIFREEKQPESDRALADAMRRHGSVVLAARLTDLSHLKLTGNQVHLPHPRFQDAVTNWGVAEAEPEPDGVVRRPWFHQDPESNPSLPWVAAQLAGASLDTPTAAAHQDRWLRYYGSKGAWTRLSYHFATNQAPGFFRDKIVFIGNRPDTPLPGDEKDEFRSPYTREAGPAASGMEILATTFLNFVNRDWLRRMDWWQESLALIIIGGLVGAGLSTQRWPMALALGVVAALSVALAGIGLVHFIGCWFPWLVVAGGQIPVATAWACFAKRTREEKSTHTETVVVPPPRPALETPGFRRVKLLGEGAYGQVWLVRNAVQEWQALKLILRSKFADDEPYNREFNGIKNYTPASRRHDGLLDIYFVSEMQPEGYFYYAMELGDSLATGWEDNPELYKARDLTITCKQADKGRLPLIECVRIGLALADSLAFLHDKGFIHRDIKPSNVVFVQGQPKLADVGLVTEIAQPERPVSHLGTPGYMAPEGPGERTGDIYSLGMLLYEISTGNRPNPDIDLSETFLEGTPEFIFLNKVICKACAKSAPDRYPTVAQMKAALEAAARELNTNAR